MSKTITINLTDSARAVVDHATRAERVIYSAYVTENAVTLDTVSDHVAALTALAVEMRRLDESDAAAVKNFKNKIRNGLNSHLGKVVPSKDKSDKFATALALKCEDREAALAKFAAEWDAARKSA